MGKAGSGCPGHISLMKIQVEGRQAFMGSLPLKRAGNGRDGGEGWKRRQSDA